MGLYNIVAEYGEKIAALEFAQTEEEQDAILAEIDSLSVDVLDKAEQYAKIIRNFETNSKGYADEIKRLQTAKKTCDNAVIRMKEMLCSAMQVTGMNTIQTSIGKWSVRKNPPSVDVIDEAKIPENFWIPQEPKLDKMTMLSIMKDGTEIPGAQLIQKEALRLS